MFSPSQKKPISNITVIRHGETTWNAPRRRIQGQSPSSAIALSEKGKKEIGEYLRDCKQPDVLICSPLLRCRQTAETWLGKSFDEINCEKHLYDELKEMDAGILTGCYADELDHKFPEYKKQWIAWESNTSEFFGFPGGENPRQFQDRVIGVFAKICEAFGNKGLNITVISHGGPISILKCFLNGKDIGHRQDYPTKNLDQLILTNDHIVKLQQYGSEMNKPQSKCFASL